MQNTPVNMKWAKNMEKEFLSGAMEVPTKVILMTTIFMDKEYILGAMAENTLESGKQIKWMVFIIRITSKSNKMIFIKITRNFLTISWTKYISISKCSTSVFNWLI